MDTKIRKLISAVMCFVCIAALTACQESGLFINNDENGDSYTLSDEITIPTSMLRNINPITSVDNDFYQIEKLIYSSLIALDDTLAPEGDLASNWSFSEDGTSIEFNLKSNLNFSDGSTLDAEDVIFSFNAYKSATQSAYSEKVSNIRSATASGSHTVIFALVNAENISISDFNFPVISSEQYNSKEIQSVTDKAIVGSGIYRMDSVDLKNEIILLPNDNYYGKKAENRIIISIMPVTDPYVGFVAANDLSIIIENNTDREDLDGYEELSVTQFTSNEAEVLGFNCESGAFANASLRKAVSYMIDKDEIIRTAYYNSGAKSDDLYYPGYYGTETTNEISKNDDKAATYLNEAGYSDSDGDGILNDEDGHSLSLRLAVNSENQPRLNAANIIANALRNKGIEVTVSAVSSETFINTVTSGNYDFFIGGWKISEDYDLRNFYHSSYSNYARYSNTELDGYLNIMSSGVDTERYLEALNKAKKIIADDVPYICLLYKTYAAVTSSDFEGLVAPRFNNYYYACNDWKIRVYDSGDEEDAENQDIVETSTE